MGDASGVRGFVLSSHKAIDTDTMSDWVAVERMFLGSKLYGE